jgi:hypothetical protein
MEASFEKTLIEVWRQVLVQKVAILVLGSDCFAVRRTARLRLRQVEFVFEGREIRGLEQNPETKSRWAVMARSGKSVMQFLSGGRYIANVVDGKVTVYAKGVGARR